ncbi:MAG: polymer-forming cytoskeletal protein, partial [Rhodobacterales bacterium]|nr:polymer-forming cytoskeletal protein [Rhodobacterales bacterium]
PAPSPRPQPGGRSVLAADVRLTGDMTSTGTVEILGEVTGDIRAQMIVIGAEGRVTGKVTADQVEIRGRLDGMADCGGFTLRSSAQVQADVAYDVLIIESGAQINGRFNRRK